MLSCRVVLFGIGVLVVTGCSGGGASSSPVPDFALQDLNPGSATYLETVSPRDHMQHATAWYFGASTSSYCRSQLGYLETMMAEIENEGHAMPIRIAGVNEPGAEAGNDAFTVGLGVPWLQDTAEEMAGASWGAEHFDLVIVDPGNVEVAVYSLIEYDLSDPVNYETIKQALAEVAAAPLGMSGMTGDVQCGAADHPMDPGADGTHDHASHGDSDMHEGQEHGDMHGDMGGDGGGMHEDPPQPCPIEGAPSEDMPMHGSATHAHP